MTRHVCPALLGRLVDQSEPPRAMRVSIPPPSPIEQALAEGHRVEVTDITASPKKGLTATIRIENSVHTGVYHGVIYGLQ